MPKRSISRCSSSDFILSNILLISCLHVQPWFSFASKPCCITTLLLSDFPFGANNSTAKGHQNPLQWTLRPTAILFQYLMFTYVNLVHLPTMHCVAPSFYLRRIQPTCTVLSVSKQFVTLITFAINPSDTQEINVTIKVTFSKQTIFEFLNARLRTSTVVIAAQLGILCCRFKTKRGKCFLFFSHSKIWFLHVRLIRIQKSISLSHEHFLYVPVVHRRLGTNTKYTPDEKLCIGKSS